MNKLMDSTVPGIYYSKKKKPSLESSLCIMHCAVVMGLFYIYIV